MTEAREQCCDCAQEYVLEDANFRPICMPCQMTKARHRQVMTKYGFPVDVNLKNLVEFFNDNDIKTNNSCENQGVQLNHATWIEFASYDDLQRLLRMMKACDDDRELYEYFQQFGNWSVCLDDESDDEDVYPSFSLRFPAKHLPTITRQFTKLAV